MEISKFAFDNLRRKPANAFFLAFSIFAASAVITLFFAIIANPYYGTDSAQNLHVNVSGYTGSGGFTGTGITTGAAFDGGIGTGIFTLMLSLLMIFICILTVFFSNKFYLLSKVEDIGIMMISGCGILKISRFLVVQNIVIIAIATPIGALVGYLFLPMVNTIIYEALDIQASVYTFTTTSMGYCFATLAIVFIWLVLVDTGFVYRMDSLSSLLKTRKSMKPLGKPKNWFMKLFYLALYLYTIYFLYTVNFKFINAFFMIYIGIMIVFGAGNVFRYLFPDLIVFCKEKFFADKKCLLISTSNLRYSIMNSNLLVTITLASCAIIIFYLCKFHDDIATFMVVLIAYIVSILLTSICIVYKLSTDALNKKWIFHNMIAIGYLKKDIKVIIRQEVIGFFFFLLLVCLPLLSSLALIFALGGAVSYRFIIGILAIFVGMVCCAGIAMYFLYCKLIFQKDLTQATTIDE